MPAVRDGAAEPAPAGSTPVGPTADRTARSAPAGSASAHQTLSQAWSVVGTVVAPATLVSALLFYFGYVSARAQFAYFGVDVDTLGFSTQEFVMRSPQPLLVPGLALLLAAAALTWLDSVVRRRMQAATGAAVRRGVRALRFVGLVLLALGLALLLGFSAVGAWDLYALATPALLSAGAGSLALSAIWSPQPLGPRRTTVVLLVLVVVASVFWATATLAQWSGTGQAKSLARDLTALPAVVVDTAEPLLPGDDAVVETLLPAQDDQSYRYRYRGLRLLAEGDGRLFLVPQTWSGSGSTFVVDLDAARVRFRFVDDPP